MSNVVPSRDDLIAQIQQSKFSITKFRERYNVDDVDDFLDLIVQKLQHDAPKAELLELLKTAKFRTASFHIGYLAKRVDAFILLLQSSLSEEIEPRR
ncbi:hypothetical protein QBL02_03545 [Leucobacter sp. UT-8R-CII-1-4]|uniref:hypothetical protein n=1 Tax=Leucobacter sp. UT-8R-CII-1-4 TaxID=3040075 RepID=UPI0024A940A6|nr:hypothetical protein [Leucobacter sp. UT-8R-CII-1-4]MDI6022614.1 hypothetical protein [Leucobacter sp. UT-8R-CII-1-4]